MHVRAGNTPTHIGKGLILVLVDYKTFLHLLFSQFTSLKTAQSQHRKLHCKKSSLSLSLLFSVLFHSTPTPTFLQTFFLSLQNAAHVSLNPFGQRCFCLIVNHENSIKTWLTKESKSKHSETWLKISAETPPTWGPGLGESGNTVCWRTQHNVCVKWEQRLPSDRAGRSSEF